MLENLVQIFFVLVHSFYFEHAAVAERPENVYLAGNIGLIVETLLDVVDVVDLHCKILIRLFFLAFIDVFDFLLAHFVLVEEIAEVAVTLEFFGPLFVRGSGVEQHESVS